jgi:hypothetical protein
MTKTLWRIEDGKPHLALHAGQARAWRSRRRFTFMVAGTQSGKTSYGPWHLAREIGKRGPGDYLAVTASYDLFKLKMLPELLRVFTGVLASEGWQYHASDRVIAKGKNGDEYRIILRSANAPGGLESATAKAAWLDECGQDDFTLETWEAVLRRLSLSEGPVLGTTTPYNLGWLKTEIYDPWTNGDPDIECIQFDSTFNPAFPKREFERARGKMQDWRFQMFYRGLFARPANLIYGCFDDAMLCDPFPIPDDWPHVTGVDFGGGANTAALGLAQGPDRTWYAYAEYLAGGKATREYVDDIHEQIGHHPAFGGAPSEQQQRMDWQAAGFYVEQPGISDVEAGIDRVFGIIKGDRFRVFRNLRGLRDELGGYRRPMDAAGNVLVGIVNKRMYHRLDCLRYGIIGAEQPAPAGDNVEMPEDVYTSGGVYGNN